VIAAARTAATLATVALLLLGAATVARAETGVYDQCQPAGDALAVRVSGTGCEQARAAATAIAGASAADTAGALQAAGWTPLWVAALAGLPSYDLVATRGLATISLLRRGETPDIDGWMAGRELLFSRSTLVPGATPPEDSALCTSSFLVRLGAHPGGLTAAHCAGLTKSGATKRRNAALRRPPQPGIVLGGVRRNLARRARPIDALVLPVPSGAGRSAVPVIDRLSTQPPWFVRGSARPLLGRRVCFSGRTSGPDNCGTIVHGFPGTRGLACTTITAREGDSGSPVYTPPRADGTVLAVGIANIVFGLLQEMCFVPLQTALHALDATLVTASSSP
jgi:hypothetical protein